MFEIRFARGVERDLRRLRVFHRQWILDAIERKLTHDPGAPGRDRKLLRGITPPWAAESPIWQLRVGEYRVFYDVGEAERVVYVRAIRRKPPHRTTEEIL